MKNNEENDNKDRQIIKDFFLIPTIKAFEIKEKLMICTQR